MKVRNLLAAISVFAVCLTTLRTLSLAAPPEVSNSPAVFVRGLMILQMAQKDALHIVLPDAPGHKATITFVMNDGERYVIPFKGHSIIKAASDPEGSTAVVKVPELIRMKELYGDGFTPLIDRVANRIEIPWSGIRAVKTDKVTNSRYTFVRKDNGEEITSFRPRNIAESLRIELGSFESLHFNGLKREMDAADVKEIWIEQVPKDMSTSDVYPDHFHHYFHYIARAASHNFDVEPRKVSGAISRSPRVGQSFWLDWLVVCGPIRID
jgi:hypothetical protein